MPAHLVRSNKNNNNNNVHHNNDDDNNNYDDDDDHDETYKCRFQYQITVKSST